ncbi:MAG TPA: hypothetical protein VJ833_10080 [Rhodanobacteraceae bacterium]|nr:hypothetical protein [Rhodanobacteraceae bacterium]
MSLISSKMILANNWVAFGGEGSAYTAEQSIVFASAGNALLPAGDWWLEPNADITFEYSKDGSTWSTGIATTYLPFIRSDGVSIRLVASAATTALFFGPA